MRQAIVTKYHGPTNTRGARVKAQASAGFVWHHWDYALGVEANHTAAAQKLADKLGRQGQWIGGVLPDESFCFVSTLA